MSVPTEVDFALVKKGDGADPEVFTQICGITDATLNFQTQTNDRYVRDCAKPAVPAFRKSKINGKSLDVQGSGMTNADNIAEFDAALGELGNYQIGLYAEDGSDGGLLLGTVEGEFRLTTHNMGLTRDAASTDQITLASNGAWAYTAA